MEKIKKLVMCLALMLCMVTICPGVLHAAGNEIRFSDPTTEKGKDVDILVNVFTPNESLTGGEIEVAYDTSMLEFQKGDAENAGNGILKIRMTPGTVNQEDFHLTFKALETGESDILVNSYYISTQNGSVLTMACGSSHVITQEATQEEKKADKDDADDAEKKEPAQKTLGDGDKVTVDGQSYTIVDDFVDQVIPEGFQRSTTVIDGKEHGAVKQEDGEAILVYLLRDGDGAFYYYSVSDNSFSVVKSVEFLPGKYLLLTSNVKGVKLPKSYKKVTFTCGETKMPGWQNDQMPGFTIVRAIDKSGFPTLYKMDSQDGTFQRFVLPKKKADNRLGGNLGKIMASIEKNIEKVITGFWIFLVVVILVIVILACKLKNRNAEILDLYEEFGVFEKEESRKKKKNRKAEPSPKKTSRKSQKKKKASAEKAEVKTEDVFANDERPLFEEEPFFDAIDVDAVMPGHFDDYENLDDDFFIAPEKRREDTTEKPEDDFNIEIMRID